MEYFHHWVVNIVHWYNTNDTSFHDTPGFNSVDSTRFLAMFCWALVFISVLKPIGRLLIGPKVAKQYDIIWAMFGGFAVMTISFSLRWYIAGNSIPIYSGLYVFCALLGIGTLIVIRKYQNYLGKADD